MCPIAQISNKQENKTEHNSRTGHGSSTKKVIQQRDVITYFVAAVYIGPLPDFIKYARHVISFACFEEISISISISLRGGFE